jgi:hypothetical protein
MAYGHKKRDFTPYEKKPDKNKKLSDLLICDNCECETKTITKIPGLNNMGVCNKCFEYYKQEVAE